MSLLFVHTQMDVVFNKLKTKVSSALPGNPLTREYDIEKQIGQAGPGLLWKLYSAKKRSTQQVSNMYIIFFIVSAIIPSGLYLKNIRLHYGEI